MAVLDSVQMEQLVREVTQAIQSNSQGVGEVPVVSSLAGINSLPALQGDNVVEAPLSLLSQVAEDAAQEVYDAIADAEDTASHPTYVGEDNYVYVWDKSNKTYNKTSIYVRGESFSISKVYPSIEDMEADTAHGLKEGDFVLINTNDVENPDNAKIYVVDAEGNFTFLVDMSGAIGFTGKTPQIEAGVITIGLNRADAGATLTENGEDEDGNPKYLLNIKIPSLTVQDMTEEEIALLQQPATDMIAKLEETDATVQANEDIRIEAENERLEAEATRKANEETRIANESTRIANEAERKEAETIRKAGETTRINNENVRQTNEAERKASENSRVSAENARVKAEEARVDAEQGRVEAENEREDNEQTRLQNESTRIEAETERIEAENARKAGEDARIEAESLRKDAEEIREANESTRLLNESSRVEAETARAEAEETRGERESVRIANESERINAEAERKDAESERDANELQRIALEQGRVAAESVRVSAEDIRIANEDTRKANESAREKNESTRIANENARVQEYAELKEDILTATDNANDAAAESRNTPIIKNGTWWIFSASVDDYVDTTTPAIAKSSEIINGTWWTWDEESNSLVDTGQSVSSDYQLTKEKIEGVFQGNITSHQHDWYVEKEDGKGLSEANFTANEKTKLASLENYDDADLTERVVKLEGDMPYKVSDLENDSEYVTATELVGKDYATNTTVTEGLDEKVDKVEGMGLSETSFTQTEKDYLATLHNYDDTQISQRVEEVADAIPTKVSQLDNDSQYVTATELEGKKYATEDSLNTGVESLQQEIATKQDKNVYFTDVTADSWIREDVYRDYPYRADLTIEGVTASDYAEVVFGMDESITGYYAPLCETKDGIVSIWSTVDKAIIVPTIIINKGVN